jgi:hypothetical protein
VYEFVPTKGVARSRPLGWYTGFRPKGFNVVAI